MAERERLTDPDRRLPPGPEAPDGSEAPGAETLEGAVEVVRERPVSHPVVAPHAQDGDPPAT